MTGSNCPACGATDVRAVLRVASVPVYSNVLHGSRNEALAVPRAEIDLVACGRCGHGFNRAHRAPPLPPLPEYESSQAHSLRFSSYVQEECDRLIERWGLSGRALIEVGCGDGSFLRALCERGVDGTGFDPALRDAVAPAAQGRFLRERYGPAWFHLKADAILCRHTLEHVDDPFAFVQMLASACDASGAKRLFLEVPDFTRIVRLAAFWDVYYEHCSYFTAPSLRAIATRAGFEVPELRTVYDGQYLWAVLERARSASPDPHAGTSQIGSEQLATFGARCASAARSWNRRLRDHAAAGRSVVLWGAGSKAAGFLAHLEEGAAIRFIVDINPYKQGSYQAGGGQEILAPRDLARLQPDLVIATNPTYAGEIERSLNAMGITSTLIALGS